MAPKTKAKPAEKETKSKALSLRLGNADMELSKPERVDKIISLVHAVTPGVLVRGSQLHQIRSGTVPTGIYDLDLLLGGGFRRSKITMVSGESGVGKTRLLVETIKLNQDLDPDFHTVVVNLETSWNDMDDLLAAADIDLDRLTLLNAESHDLAMDLTAELARSRQIDLLIIDSVASLISDAEADKSQGENQKMAARGSALEWFSRKLMAKLQTSFNTLTRRVEPNPTAVVFINQMRTEMVKVGGGGQVTRRVAASAKSLRFFLDCSIFLHVQEDLTYVYDGDHFKDIGPNEQTYAYVNGAIIGQRVVIEVDKSRAGPFRGLSTTIDLYTLNLQYKSKTGFMGVGFDRDRSLVRTALFLGIITKNQNSAHHYFEDEIFPSEDKLMFRLREDGKLLNRISEAVLSRLYPDKDAAETPLAIEADEKESITVQITPTEVKPKEKRPRALPRHTKTQEPKHRARKKTSEKPRSEVDETKRGRSKKS